MPIGEGSNLLLVVSCQCVPFILILLSNGGEIARENLSARDLIKGGLNFGFIIGNLLFEHCDVGLDQRVAVLNELALAAVLAEVGRFVGCLELLSGHKEGLCDFVLDHVKSGLPFNFDGGHGCVLDLSTAFFTTLANIGKFMSLGVVVYLEGVFDLSGELFGVIITVEEVHKVAKGEVLHVVLVPVEINEVFLGLSVIVKVGSFGDLVLIKVDFVSDVSGIDRSGVGGSVLISDKIGIALINSAWWLGIGGGYKGG